MGTALVLLVLLALGAIPGALLPQRSLNAGKVDEYLAGHRVIGPWLNRLQAFDVFSSFWFTAIYVLLFVSLVGCLTPRMIEHARSLRATPVAAPRNLARLPRHAGAQIPAGPEEVNRLANTITKRLGGWRTAIRHQDDAVEVSAEKGYLREFGNIVFHFSLLGLLVAVAVGKLFGYEGNVIVIADGGPGFCSASPAAFDSFRAGNTVDGTSLHPICLRVNNFQAHYLASGQATSFTSDVDYQAGHDLTANSWRHYLLAVNHPLRVDGDRVYLQGHGYAPTFTVTFPDGQTRTSTVQWRPDNPQTLLSSGVARIDPPAGSYPNPAERRKHEIAIQGLLAPTEQLDGTLLSSRFPALDAPAVAVDIYRGDTGLDSGRPQSLFTLDPRLIEQGRLAKEKRVNLRAGQEVRLDQGPAAGTVVRFDGAVPFVNLQVSHDPGQTWVLVFAITMMTGLLVSLLVRRRRVWVRLTPAAGTVNVELGGLARTDNSGWGDEFERLTERLLAGLGETGPADRAETPPASRRSSQVDVK
jgi:cytochrome c biogenesis protein